MSGFSYQHTNDEPPTPITTPIAATNARSFPPTPDTQVGTNESRRFESNQYHPSPGLAQLRTYVAAAGSAAQAPTGSRRPSAQSVNVQLAAHVHHLSPDPHLSLPPVDPSKQLASSPAAFTTPTPPLKGRIDGHSERTEPPSAGTILTPPYTAGRPPPLERQQSLPAAIMGDNQNSTKKVSTMGPPETPSRVMQPSPQLFPSLQFSPDLFQPQFGGPATAAVYPQQRLFWDTSSSINVDGVVPSQFQNSFRTVQTDLVHPFTPSPALSHGFDHVPAGPELTYDLPSSQVSQSTETAPPYFEELALTAPFTASSRPQLPIAEDPSLFLSSPARRFGPPAQSTGFASTASRMERQPYHHQIEESKREEEFERAKRARTKRHSGSQHSANLARRPVSPVSDGRPGIKRSLTHSGEAGRDAHVRQHSQVSFSESVAVANGEPKRLSRGGRTSPLKRISRTSLISLPERPSSQRTSLTFTIDKDGRAKTVVTPIPDPLCSEMDLDDSSDSGTESGDETDLDFLKSQSNSFMFDGDDRQRSFVHSKLDLKAHSKRSSYSSTFASSNSTYQSSRTSSNPGGVRPGTHRGEPNKPAQTGVDQVRNKDAKSVDVSFFEDASEDEQGDAQHALRAVLRDRPRSTSSQGSFTKRRSGQIQQFHSSPPIQPGNSFGTYNASPTTITDPDLATPSTDRESYASNGSTRCVCSSSSPDGQFMIQWYVRRHPRGPCESNSVSANRVRSGSTQPVLV